MAAIPRASAQSLEGRLDAIESVQAIQALKAYYGGLADQKYTLDRQRQPDARMQELARLQAECFTEDAVWEGGAGFGDSLVGRAQLRDWFNRSPWCFALHYYVSPEIAVQGETATGRWRLWQIALRADNREAVLLAAVTSEAYARQPDGRWLHTHMRFDQIHMLPVGPTPDPLVATLAAATPFPLAVAGHSIDHL